MMQPLLPPLRLRLLFYDMKGNDASGALLLMRAEAAPLLPILALCPLN